MISEVLRQRLQSEGSLTLTIRARPGAKKTQFRDILEDGSMKIDIAAAPEDGAANAELIRFIADLFGVSTASVTLLSGQTSRQKVIRISL